MKTMTALTGASFAMLFAFAAQSAQAAICPAEGPSGWPEEVQVLPADAEPCYTGGSTTVSTSGVDGGGAPYSATIVAESPDTYLMTGDVVEVEVEYETVVAALRSDEKTAVALAAAIGVRPQPGKDRAVDVANHSTPKLTDEEYSEMASYVLTTMQARGTATGRSNPAPDNFQSRVQATAQAFSNAMSSIGAAIGRALPDIRFRSTTRTRDANNVVRQETVVEIDVAS